MRVVHGERIKRKIVFSSGVIIERPVGKIKHKTLSLCFDAGEDSTKDGVFAGLMTMGGRTTSSARLGYSKSTKFIYAQGRWE